MKIMLTEEQKRAFDKLVFGASKDSADMQEAVIRKLGIELLRDIYGEKQLSQLFEKAYIRRLETIWCNMLQAKKVSVKLNWHNDTPEVRVQVLER